MMWKCGQMNIQLRTYSNCEENNCSVHPQNLHLELMAMSEQVLMCNPNCEIPTVEEIPGMGSSA